MAVLKQTSTTGGPLQRPWHTVLLSGKVLSWNSDHPANKTNLTARTQQESPKFKHENSYMKSKTTRECGMHANKTIWHRSKGKASMNSLGMIRKVGSRWCTDGLREEEKHDQTTAHVLDGTQQATHKIKSKS